MINADQFPLLDHIATGIVAIDRHGTIVLWNKQMEGWSRQSRQQVLGQCLFTLFPETATDTFKPRIEQVLYGGAPVIFAPQLHHHLIQCPLDDGTYRAQLVTITWLKKQQIALFSIQDQSEQCKLVEQHKASARQLQSELDQRKQLEQTNQQLISAIDQAGEAIIITNRAGQIEYVNKTFQTQTGWNSDEVCKRIIYQLLFNESKSVPEHPFQQVFALGDPWQGRQSVSRKDGSLFTASISMAPILNALGETTHYIMIQEDISDQITLEEKFRHTQKQEALITLIGGIAHDFNNLLAGLVGQVYLASREVSELPRTKERMQKIQGIAHEASEIVKQLLTFARQGEHHSKEFSLNSFIKELMKLSRHSVPESIALVPDFDSGSYAFRGDANQLQQAMLNIVQNAADACRDMSQGRIEIGLFPFISQDHPGLLNKYPVLRHGNFAHIQVRDNGCGMSTTTIEKIFDPFFSTKQLGSGLGLAMVLGCIRNHHGIIDVESSLGNGTTMHLFLPVLTPPAAPVSHDHTRPSASAHILLVDDDERVLEPTRELLECMGHHVTLAKDGMNACEVFEQQPERWDILITDMVMPRMNGLESAKVIRQLRPDIPVIFATGYDPTLVTDSARNMENTTLISKPFNPDELDRLITKMVARKV